MKCGCLNTLFIDYELNWWSCLIRSRTLDKITGQFQISFVTFTLYTNTSEELRREKEMHRKLGKFRKKWENGWPGKNINGNKFLFKFMKKCCLLFKVFLNFFIVDYNALNFVSEWTRLPYFLICGYCLSTSTSCTIQQ